MTSEMSQKRIFSGIDEHLRSWVKHRRSNADWTFKASFVFLINVNRFLDFRSILIHF
jgi:hypothetical protein